MYPEIDDAVFKWFIKVRNLNKGSKPIPISRAIIQARAKREAAQHGIVDFVASDGWFRNWRRRKNIGKSVYLRGEAGDVNIQEAARQIQQLSLKLSQFKEDHIYNMDQTSLFYRALPTRSYIVSSEDSRQTGRGSKSLTAKDRVTLLLCVNASGILNPPPLMIGKYGRPACFRGFQIPIKYYQQKKSWCDKDVSLFWWNEIFLPHVRSHHEDPVALILDNFSGHKVEFKDHRNQITILYLPPNTTSISQPLDQGIIATLKINYRQLLLERMVSVFENREELQVHNLPIFIL